jgi:hypothetical protein
LRGGEPLAEVSLEVAGVAAGAAVGDVAVGADEVLRRVFDAEAAEGVAVGVD